MKNDVNQSPPIIPGIAKGNIDTIMQIEQAYLRQRSGVDRLGEAVSRFAEHVFFRRPYCWLCRLDSCEHGDGSWHRPNNIPTEATAVLHCECPRT
jgi:hypothetical protein